MFLYCEEFCVRLLLKKRIDQLMFLKNVVKVS